MNSKITNVRADYNTELGTFCIFIDTEDSEEARLMRPLLSLLTEPSCPEETRLAWAISIFCPKDLVDVKTTDKELQFHTRQRAERVAKRANKELKALRANKPPLDGIAAQLAYAAAGGTVRGMQFNLDRLRHKIAGA